MKRAPVLSGGGLTGVLLNIIKGKAAAPKPQPGVQLHIPHGITDAVVSFSKRVFKGHLADFNG